MNARHPFPRHGWIGLALIAICWPLNWGLPGLRTHLLFFPLWLGYILCMSALTHRRRGSSLLARSPVRFTLLFVISAPVWWFFEAVNLRTGNWEYLGRDQFSDLEYGILASICFSTVIPAVFATHEWLAAMAWPQRFSRRRPWRIGPSADMILVTIGAVMTLLLLAWPRYFYPLTWSIVFFFAEPINHRRSQPSILTQLGQGNWRHCVTLPAAALVCGFFWEMWNILAYPKWIYHIPYVDFFRVFEMPILGYIGYLPFGLDLFAFYHLVTPRRWRLDI